MDSRADKSEGLLRALAWIREARDGPRGISARYIAWLWATFGQDHFLPLRGINAVCDAYQISPRTMRWNLEALRKGFGIGRHTRPSCFAAAHTPETSERQDDDDESGSAFAGTHTG